MNIIKPKKLQKGDTIGILAVSGKIKEYTNIEKAKSFLESKGYKVVISNTCKTFHNYQAGNNDDDDAFWTKLGNWFTGNGWATNQQKLNKITLLLKGRII